LAQNTNTGNIHFADGITFKHLSVSFRIIQFSQ